MGFKNSRRGTTFAAQSAGQAAALKAKEFGFEKVRVKLKGLGQGRQVAMLLQDIYSWCFRMSLLLSWCCC